jgi:hypothetical protein
MEQSLGEAEVNAAVFVASGVEHPASL